MKRLSQEEIKKLRKLPLSEVLMHIGALPDPNDKHNWRIQGHRIQIDGFIWSDHSNQKGGGGAINLLMHIEHCDFSTACEKLMAMPPLGAPMSAPQASHKRYSTTPDSIESHWPVARKYLVKQRGIDPVLVDELHRQGMLQADRHFNCLFFSRDKKSCEMRGTFNAKYHGYRGKKKPFYIEGKEEIGTAFTESAIDALSLKSLGFTGCIISFGGQAMDSIISIAQDAITKGCPVFAAFDNDDAGMLMAEHLARMVTGIQRMTPSFGKDWNDVLVQQNQEKLRA